MALPQVRQAHGRSSTVEGGLLAIEYAFKCRACGALEPPGAAGDLARPAKCHICGAGVKFDPDTGVRILQPDNWIVLADLDGDGIADIVAFHGLTEEHAIVAHVPPSEPGPESSEMIEVAASDVAAVADVVGQPTGEDQP